MKRISVILLSVLVCITVFASSGYSNRETKVAFSGEFSHGIFIKREMPVYSNGSNIVINGTLSTYGNRYNRLTLIIRDSDGRILFRKIAMHQEKNRFTESITAPNRNQRYSIELRDEDSYGNQSRQGRYSVYIMQKKHDIVPPKPVPGEAQHFSGTVSSSSEIIRHYRASRDKGAVIVRGTLNYSGEHGGLHLTVINNNGRVVLEKEAVRDYPVSLDAFLPAENENTTYQIKLSAFGGDSKSAESRYNLTLYQR